MSDSYLCKVFRFSVLSLAYIPLLAFSATKEIKKDLAASIQSVVLADEQTTSELPLINAPLADFGIASVALESQNKRLELEKKIAELEKELEVLKAENARAAQSPISVDDKMAYAAGLSLIPGVRARLNSWAEVGVTLDPHWFETGLRDGLENQRRLEAKEFDEAWKAFAERIQYGIHQKVKASEASLHNVIGNKAPAITKDGVVYFVVNQGQAVADKHAPVRLSLREQIVEGSVVSEVPSLTVSEDDNLPAVIRNALPLLGVGSDVTAYGLAKSVYGSLPLPENVQPYTVLEYHFKGLKAV